MKNTLIKQGIYLLFKNLSKIIFLVNISSNIYEGRVLNESAINSSSLLVSL